MLGVELEVLAKKYDRFGWDRDRGKPAHDRIVADWMAALQDYPLDEVQKACAAAVLANPNRMPNEGHVLAQILEARREAVAKAPPREVSEPEPTGNRMTAEEADRIIAEVVAAKRTGAA